MSPKQWFVLLCFYVSYLFFGASIFYHIEHGIELEQRANSLVERIGINELLVKYTSPEDEKIQNNVLNTVSDYCGRPVTNYTLDEHPDDYLWSFYHAFWFAFITCSTVGYGNISPRDSLGQIFLIFYALIGLPVNGFLLAYLGDFFGKTFIGIYTRYKEYKYATTSNYTPQKFGMFLRIMLYLIPGIVFFVFLPACLFSYFEDWPYVRSVYYAFVTLTTIGFGDFVPTFQNGQETILRHLSRKKKYPNDIRFGAMGIRRFSNKIFDGVIIAISQTNTSESERLMWVILPRWGKIWVALSGFDNFEVVGGVRIGQFEDLTNPWSTAMARNFGLYFTFYQIFIIFWNILGVGYFIMIIGFIAKGMQSKRIARLEHQLSENIKSTQHRIWTGVTKDIGFLRRILNEVNMMKFKPVYTDSTEKSIFNSFPRSSSCPDLTMYRDETPRIIRKRAYSENYAQPLDSSTISTMTLNRVQSDGDLSRIDKKKTFEGSDNMFKTGDLLSRVVNALGSIRPMDEDGQSCLELGMDGGIHGFSDSEILASERTWSGWSLDQSDGSHTNPPVRKRAASDFRIPQQDSFKNSYEWTWNGNNASQIKEYTRKKSNKYSIATMLPNKNDSNNRSVTLNIPDTLKVPTEAVNRSFMSKINPFKARVLGQDGKRHSVAGQDMNPQIYLENTSKGRESRISLPRQYLSATARGRNSVFSILEQPLTSDNSDLLEKTTIADLIRALEVVHTKANMSPDTPFLSDYTDSPKRKIGTVTPPSPPNLNNLQVPTSRSRRGSLRPVPGYTTIFASKNINNSRKKPPLLDPESAAFSRRPSIRPTNPPPYTLTPKLMRRRFSVRPTNLSIPPGEAPPPNPSIQASSTLQRRLSLRPSPLARNIPSQTSGRYSRQSSHQLPMISINDRLQTPNVTTRNLMWRPAQLHASRTRHGSLSELHEKSERKRSDSK